MAEVFLARAEGPLGFEKQLVVKRMLEPLFEDPKLVQLFLNEAKVAAMMNHPNVVQIFDFGEADGRYYIAMEHVDGPSLRTVLDRAAERGIPVPAPVAAKVLALAAEGLGYAHALSDPQTGRAMGLIHRDISPDNILLSRAGAVKVADFGIAKLADPQHKTKTMRGKYAYMSPEQLKGDKFDHRSDLFALGLVLYEVMTGRRPFDAETERAVMWATVFDDHRPASELRPDLPPKLGAIIDRALKKTPEARYQRCAEMQRDLEAVWAEAQGSATGAIEIAKFLSSLELGGTPEAERLPYSARGESELEQAPVEGQRRSRWPLWIGLAVGLLAALAAAAWAAAR
jgi:serine/threonine-protein kinase